MVEIGMKDIIDRNYLSMEPFDRNCSFRALDFSHKQISDELIARQAELHVLLSRKSTESPNSLMSQIFDLLEQGHISPIHPIQTFSFESIASAFAYMRSGRHIGKVVITNGESAKVEVPVRPAQRHLVLRSDVSYLIVGGLRGLCGSLAIHLAQHGAKCVVIMSRSGCQDEKSQDIVRNCNALGCEVVDAKADVCNLEEVRRAFKQAPLPIGGAI